MKDLKINDIMWHPCSIDIIQHKVTSIRQFDGFRHIVLKSVHNVGACGRVEVIVSENNGKYRFVELMYEDSIEHASGLQDFVEGNYYTDKREAKLEFYKQQETLSWASMDRQKRLYDKCKENYERVKLIVKNIKEDLKQISNG